MNLIVAGRKKAYPDKLTIASLIEAESLATPQYVTVCVNDELVDQGGFETYDLKDGDQVEFLYFMGGGGPC
jgi:sulfur carrier protein